MDKKKIGDIYDYLTSGLMQISQLKFAEGIFIFGRKDKKLAEVAASIYSAGLSTYVLVSGGIGKDSGDLGVLGIPEAEYLAVHLLDLGVSAKNILLEKEAKNGGENSRLCIDKILKNRGRYGNLIVLAHPTSAKRLFAVHMVEERKKGLSAKHQLVGSSYVFDVENSIDQQEAIAELLRLADWPAKGWAEAQPDLPMDLVEWAREQNRK